MAGVNNTPDSGVLLVSKKVDPNKTHPLTQKKLLSLVGGDVNGTVFNSRSAQALFWKHGIKEKERFSWKNDNTGTYQYSHDLVAWVKKQSSNTIRQAREEYSQYLRGRKNAC